MHVYIQRIAPAFAYPVLFTRDLFGAGSHALRQSFGDDAAERRALVFLDGGLAEAQPDLARRMAACFATVPGLPRLAAEPIVVPGGEAIKNDYRLVMAIVDQILEQRLCRHSFVVAAGGGAVLDAVGFAASIVHRGVRLLRLPSTVLAQNDAGIGVKNGMNLHGGKNTIGTFAPPHAVVNDLDLLDSLPDREWRAGIAEAFKVALIKDADFFEFLCGAASRLKARDAAAMERLVIRCAELHLDHIRDHGDPFEMGSARPLDFGHWAAHKLECMSGYRIGHGQAVAAGMALDAIYAEGRGWIAPALLDRFLGALEDCGLPLWYDELDRRLGDGRHQVLLGIEEFREHLGGRLCVTFPAGAGRRREEDAVDLGAMAASLDRLRARAEQATR